MKKFTVILLCLLLCLPLGGCIFKTPLQSATYLYFDTSVTITARCNRAVLDGAFSLCKKYEKMFSRTVPDSDIGRINAGDIPVTVSDETAELLNKAIAYGKKTDGLFDVTIAPVSSLYDFSSGVLPDSGDIQSALKKVDYRRLAVDGNTVTLNDGQVDLGGIAKGYVADRVVDYLKENGVKSALISLGGNLWTVGDEYDTVNIKRPFGTDNIAKISIKDSTFVTSGIDQRYIEKDGIIYHHILDPRTGYGVDNALASVTVIGKNSAECDALSTSLMLLGYDKGLALIKDEQAEAVFCFRDGTVRVSAGLEVCDGIISYRS